MTLSGTEIAALVGSYFWPFIRIGAAFMAAPVTGSKTVPVRVRLAMALVITSVVVPVMPPGPAIDPFSLPALSIIIQQVLIGVAMGFSLQLVFSAVVTGGQVIAMKMGLGFASMVDPQNGRQVPVVSQFYLLLVTLLFLVFNGHLMLVRFLVDSFEVLPVAADGITRDGIWTLVSWGSRMFEGAVWLAVPAVGSLLVVNTAFGVMARAAPQLNIFAVGFPMTLIFGFVVLLFALPTVVPQFRALMNEGFALAGRVLAGG